MAGWCLWGFRPGVRQRTWKPTRRRRSGGRVTGRVWVESPPTLQPAMGHDPSGFSWAHQQRSTEADRNPGHARRKASMWFAPILSVGKLKFSMADWLQPANPRPRLMYSTEYEYFVRTARGALRMLQRNYRDAAETTEPMATCHRWQANKLARITASQAHTHTRTQHAHTHAHMHPSPSPFVFDCHPPNDAGRLM